MRYITCIPILVFLTLLISHLSLAQSSRIDDLHSRLESYSYEIPHLKNKMSVSISGVTLYELLRGVATENKLNLNIDPSLDTLVSINLIDVSVSDLLAYLCEQYNAEIFVTGNNILSIVKYIPPKVAQPVLTRKLNITYDSSNNLLSFDLQNDTLGHVLKYITRASRQNIVLPQKLQAALVGGYVERMPLRKALGELAHMNNLQLVERDSATFSIEENSSKNVTESTKANSTNFAGIRAITNGKDSILAVSGSNVPIKDVLSAITSKLQVNYFILSELKGNVDIKLENTDLNNFLRYLFNGTDFTFRYSNGVYLIGERKLESIRTSSVYKLMYRTTTKIMEIIPAELKKGIEIIPLTDLNSLVMSGSAPAVSELEMFLRQIDKTVPVITIELIILDVNKTHSINTGISAGIANQPVQSSYPSIFPTVDVTLGAKTINDIISSINGTGLVNLGYVNSNFYLSLQASEENGAVKIRSTPKLATLNGTEAQMAIGETRYYAETSSNIIATQSTTTVNSTIYKPLQANLSITIKPIVSGDEQITLDINVDQGSFTTQIATNGPYGQATRNFKSSIRVKNNDMILLGGLEQRNNSDIGKGMPILSRIPILKWLFSSRNTKNTRSKLAILIHPTVIY